MRECFLRAMMSIALVLALAVPGAAQITSPATPNPTERELVVGTKEAPPFAMKARDGSWEGISIELWRHVADQLRLRYRLQEEPTVQGLIDGIAAGKFDVAVAAITPTAARERSVDFTQVYYAAGLGIAVPLEREPGWRPVTRAIFSFGFAQAVLVLLALALSTGGLVWLFERKRNELFGGGVARGLGSGVLWSASAMTQRATGPLQPQSLPGRIVAIFWMVSSIIAIAVFTAGITSALTTRQLRGVVNDIGDLSSVRVGYVSGTSTEDALLRMRIGHSGFATLDDALKALRDGKIGALVHDKPILAWVIREQFASSVELLDIGFAPQSYAMALTEGSPMRKTLNSAILEATQGDWWDRLLFRYLGAKS
jgi:ABC-type amino acid transport substrate-binding protein